MLNIGIPLINKPGQAVLLTALRLVLTEFEYAIDLDERDHVDFVLEEHD